MISSEKTPYAIEARQLSKSFSSSKSERKVVLNEISFTVPSGKIVSFLGHNGAGKTTLIRIISTLIEFDAGSVQVFSHDLKAGASKIRELISTTGQFAAVDPNLTGRENLEFFGRLRQLKAKNAALRATELLEQFELMDAADKKVSEYSGGMRRRLDIAVSLVVIPQLLFLDEPTTGLDPVSREHLWEFIRKLRASGMTLVLTTQYLEEAEALADLVYLLKDTKIVASGTPDELRHDLGTNVMKVNFVESQQASVFGENLKTTGLRNLDIRGKTVSCDVSSSLEAIKVLNSVAANTGIEPDSLSIAPPTLNEVFIRLNDENLKKVLNDEY